MKSKDLLAVILKESLFGKKKKDPQIDKNEEILKLIYDLGLDSHEGNFEPKTWKRSGNLLPSEKRNDEIISDFAGLSLSYDTKLQTYKLLVPVKYKQSFFNQIKSTLEKTFNIIDYNSSGYTKTIIFK